MVVSSLISNFFVQLDMARAFFFRSDGLLEVLYLDGIVVLAFTEKDKKNIKRKVWVSGTNSLIIVNTRETSHFRK